MREEIFSERLSEAIKATGLSQAEVAKKAGITAPYLSDLRKGKKGNPSQKIISALAEALSTTPTWLMSYVDNAGITVLPSAQKDETPREKDPRMVSRLQAARTFNSRLEPQLSELVQNTLEQLDASLSTAAVNDGHFQDRMIQICHDQVDACATEIKKIRAKPETQT